MTSRRTPTPLRSSSMRILSPFSIFSTMLVTSIWTMNFVAVMVQGLSSTSTSTGSRHLSSLSTISLPSVEARQFSLIDGAEWASLQPFCQSQGNNDKHNSKYGYMNVLLGRDNDGNSVIGIQSEDGGSSSSSSSSNSDSCSVYEQSIAKIPSGIHPDDAISTYVASLSTIHTVLPKSETVGGSQDTTMISGKVVIVGSNDLACFAAEGLTHLGSGSDSVQVYLVSASGKVANSKVQNNPQVQILPPAVGSDGVGFAEYIGSFDCLLDTIGNEKSIRTPSATATAAVALSEEDVEEEDEDDDDEEEGDNPFMSIFSGENTRSVLTLLQKRHQCDTYVSTLTHCQSLITKEGIFSGPKQSETYTKSGVGQSSFVTGNPDCQPIVPWSNFGTTVEALLEAKVIFTAKSRRKLYKDGVRTWTMGDFWEQSTWPRDSSGSAQVRFGLPVVEDRDLDEEPMLLETPVGASGGRMPSRQRLSAYQQFNKEDANEPEDQPPKIVQTNPFVHQVGGVPGLRTEIINENEDCILFLSAKFCKTCRTLDPQYTRMARISKEEKQAPILYAKAEASGKWGKELGRYLNVDAVPAFILFRKGERFGSPLSVSRLPSKKIDKAIRLLEAGQDWDPAVLRSDEKKKS